MKKFSFLFVALLALVSCSTEMVPNKEFGKDKVHLIVKSGEPKTYLDNNMLPNWETSDRLGVFVDNLVYETSVWDGSLYNMAASGRQSSFEGEVPASLGTEHTLYAVYPYSSLYQVYANLTIGVEVPSTQYPRVASFDPAADILLGEPYNFTPVSNEYTIEDMRFARALAILKLQPSGAPAGDVISSARITAPVTLTGRARLDMENGAISGWTIQKKDVSAIYTDEKPVLGTDAIYLLVNPQIISSGSELTFEFFTDNNFISKTVTLPYDVVLEAGNITRIGVNLTSANCTSWEDFDITDTIVASDLAATSTTYTLFSNVAKTSNARYSGQSATNYSAIQLRSNYSNSGIVSTVSAGNVRKVEVTWNSNTGSGRVLNVYGSNTAYTAATDLYNADRRGTLLGTIAYGSSSSLDVSGNYAYVGVCSNSGALYLDDISFTWRSDDITPVCDNPVINCSSNVVSISCATSGVSIYYTLDGSAPSSSSLLYEGPFNISSTVTVKAIALRDGYYDSSITSALCVFDEGGGGGGGSALAHDGWLELPAASSASGYYCITHRAKMGGIDQRNYSLLYDPSTYTSYWVAYPLCSSHTGSGRSGSWGYDPDIPQSAQTDVSGGYGVDLSTKNYSKNTYSRGHQIPNADRSGVSAMQSQTYIATNSTPQIQNGFNGEIWSTLENSVRSAIPSHDTLYVVTGACFNKVGESKTVKYITNKNDGKSIPVPNYYWKVLLKVKRSGSEITDASAVGFWFPHEDLHGESFTSYSVSVDQIEAWTGFDFFVNLKLHAPASVEANAESNSTWGTFFTF